METDNASLRNGSHTTTRTPTVEVGSDRSSLVGPALVAAYLGLTGLALLVSGLAVATVAGLLPGGALSTAFVLTAGVGLLAASPAAARWALATALDARAEARSTPTRPSATGSPVTPEERRRTAGADADFWR